MRRPPKPESFDKFYYNKVALGEGCGCAERIIDVHEFNRKAGALPVTRRIPVIGALARVLRLFKTGTKRSRTRESAGTKT